MFHTHQFDDLYVSKLFFYKTEVAAILLSSMDRAKLCCHTQTFQQAELQLLAIKRLLLRLEKKVKMSFESH